MVSLLNLSKLLPIKNIKSGAVYSGPHPPPRLFGGGGGPHTKPGGATLSKVHDSALSGAMLVGLHVIQAIAGAATPQPIALVEAWTMAAQLQSHAAEIWC